MNNMSKEREKRLLEVVKWLEEGDLAFLAYHYMKEHDKDEVLLNVVARGQLLCTGAVDMLCCDGNAEHSWLGKGTVRRSGVKEWY